MIEIDWAYVAAELRHALKLHVPQDRHHQPTQGATAMPKPSRLSVADAKKRITAASEHLRTAGRNAPSWRRTDNPDGTVDFHAADGEPLFTITGIWAQPVADYLDVVHPTIGVGLAELLWQLGDGGGDALSTAAGVADQITRKARE